MSLQESYCFPALFTKAVGASSLSTMGHLQGHEMLPQQVPLLALQAQRMARRRRISSWCNSLSWFLPLGQILVLESVPDINLLDYLPEILDGLFQILGDNGKEIRKM